MADVDPDSTPGLKGGKQRALRDIKKHQDVLFELHERLYAERKRSLLVVLQGMDTSGKDGTVTHVVRNFNPQGVLIARVHNLATPQIINRRYEEINAFEKALVRSGTAVVKICLDISYAEQRKRLMARLKDPDKHWKFSEHDIDERAYWDDYMSAYGLAVTKCSTA